MHADHDDDYDPEHDRFLDSGDDLDEMFADELEDDGDGEPGDESSFRDVPDPNEDDADDEDDDDDEFHSGLDDDF